MSIPENILNLMEQNGKTFSIRFAFYLEAIDQCLSLQGQIGLEEDDLKALPEDDQNYIKAYIFLMESSNTTWSASIRLLSAGLFSDAYGLIRILYETGGLLHYGNFSPPDTRAEVYQTMFNSGLREEEHRKNEWALIQKATRLFEKEKPELIQVRKDFNNFGGHISRSKIMLGNIVSKGNASASRVFYPEWTNKYYLAGLEFLFYTSAIVLEEYSILYEDYGGLSPEKKEQVFGLAEKFQAEIRPKLQAMKK